MAEAARIVEGIGADIVDVNMGCPVPKIAKGHAGCRLMREPEQAVAIVSAMVGAVKIPVTVKMRSGWDDKQVVAPEFAARMEGAGAAAVTVHGRTGAQAFRGSSDWDVIARVARAVKIPVFGNGDCVEAGQVVDRWHESGVAGVLVGRGVVRNPWMLAQAADVAAGRAPRAVEAADRARFLLDYIELLMGEPDSEPGGFRHAPSHEGREHRPAGGHRRTTRSRAASTARDRERWVIGKVRALAAWYTKGLEGGAEFRATINRADSIDRVRESLRRLFGGAPGASHGGEVTADADLRV